MPLFQRLDKITGIAFLSVIIMRNTNILTSEYWNFLLGFSGLIFFRSVVAPGGTSDEAIAGR